MNHTEAPRARAGTPLPSAVYTAIDRAARSLAEASAAERPAERFVAAHVAALQLTAAVLAARARPAGRGRPTSAWVLLARTVPELVEWSNYFAAGAGKRALAESGLDHVVSGREADELVRATGQFFTEVAELLGLTPSLVLTPVGHLAPMTEVMVAGLSHAS